MSEGPNRGGFSVPLTVPVQHAGKTIDIINIAPARLDHAVRWAEGKISTTVALLAELTGLTEEELRSITYPDVDRVMGAFMMLLPPAIATDIRGGVAHAPTSAGTNEPDDGNDTGLDLGQG